MLLEILFAAPREAAETGGRPGNAPADSAEAFTALLAALDGKAHADTGAPREGAREMPESGVRMAAPETGEGEGEGESPPPARTGWIDIEPAPTAEGEPAPTEAVPETTGSAEAPATDTTLPAPAAPLPAGPAHSKSHDSAPEKAAAAPATLPEPDEDAPAADETAGLPKTGGDAATAGNAAPAEAQPAIEPLPARETAATQFPSANATLPGTAKLAGGEAKPAPVPASGQATPDARPAQAAPVASATEPAEAEAAMVRREMPAGDALRTDGQETRLAAFARREMAAGRDEGEVRTAQPSSEKQSASARPATPVQPSAASLPAQPAPATASVPNPALFTQAGLAAFLTGQASQQSAPVEPLTLTTGSESGEIRLEAGQQVTRSETPNAQAARTAGPAHLRLASAQVPAIAQLIARRFGEGGRSFDIRLDPPELGRVHVRLEIGADRTVQAMLTAEKPEALNELQRHARELERALAEAGLDLDGSGIGFALFGDGNEAGDDAASHRSGGDTREEAVRLAAIEAADLPPALQRFGFTLAQRGGVDVRI
ncbi:MAG: flagellar hook-length control protein FliK [Glycocaulis sp.]